MDDLKLRTVNLSFTRNNSPGRVTRTNSETWITMIEQLLSCEYDDYKISVTTDSYQRRTDVEIIFATVDDATWFRLKQV
jgi:hypothetical protein